VNVAVFVGVRVSVGVNVDGWNGVKVGVTVAVGVRVWVKVGVMVPVTISGVRLAVGVGGVPVIVAELVRVINGLSVASGANQIANPPKQ
jgi:hypothetical protein